MLVKHPVNGKLSNVVSDEHAMGVLWMAKPIVVIYTYEHAFYVDYQNRKADYIKKSWLTSTGSKQLVVTTWRESYRHINLGGN